MTLDLAELLSAPARQTASLSETAHRPWPVPERGWAMAQTWDDLLFAHWRVDADAVRTHLPAGLELDTWDGGAWLGVTPFTVTGLRLRGMPPVPVLSSFHELNVRTYVRVRERPGIWFFSLDASSPLAVQAARRTYRLPYHRARIHVRHSGEWLAWSSARAEGAGRPFVLEGRYRPAGPVAPARAGSLEHFLVERYCLYTADEGRLFCADIHHAPWPLQPAEAAIELNTMAPDGVELPDGAPLVHFSRRQDTLVWPLEPCP